MQPVTRRSFLATGTAGAIGVAGAATIGAPFASAAAAATPDELSPSEAAAHRGPTMVHIVDAAAGKVEILHGERTIAVTDKTLVARVLRATR
jgi:Cu/Ag efflux protein CusF